MSKNLVIFLLLVGGVFYLAYKNMKSKLNPLKQTTEVSKPGPAKEEVVIEEETEKDEKVANEKVPTFNNYKAGLYVCPDEISLSAYGLSSDSSSDGFYFKKANPMTLTSAEYNTNKITCRYNSGLGGFYFLYQSIRETQCRKINQGFGYQCDDAGSVRKYECWEIRTSSTEEPYLRLRMEPSGGEDISMTRGWEYTVPKGELSGVRINNKREMECAYSIPISGEFVLENAVTNHRKCERKGKGVSCY